MISLGRATFVACVLAVLFTTAAAAMGGQRPAAAPTTATLTTSLSSQRPGGRASLTLTLHLTSGTSAVPAPLRRSVLRLPAGMSLDVPKLRSCSAERLRRRGTSGCPARSRIGSGHAVIEVHAGSQTIAENVALSAFVGPIHDLAPTIEVLGQGYTPLHRRLILSGAVVPADPPYGEGLAMSIPPIPSLPLEPAASIATFSLTVGTKGPHPAHGSDAVIVPLSCPPGGFPFAAEVGYADGASAQALSTIACQ